MLKQNKYFTRRELGGLLGGLLITFAVNQTMIDKKSYMNLDNKIKDIIEISTLFVFALIGYWGLKKKTSWIKNLWRYFYTLSIGLLIIAALTDWLIYHYSTNQQYRFYSIKEKLASPLLYLLLLSLDAFYKKSINITKKVYEN